MPAPAVVTIHPSQFPEAIEKELLRSLRTRQVNHKFHYDSPKQTLKWLALHEAYSPARKDNDCLLTYEAAFAATAARIKSNKVQIISLGCGGGQKDTQLLKLLRKPGRELFYTPCDVSTSMVLAVRKAASKYVAAQNCFPFVCDLLTANDLRAAMDNCLVPGAFRIVTFFGMIPNFEPQQILPRLASFIGPKDLLLFSANLAPGSDYAQGLNQILPQYNNPLTKDWLMAFLFGLGVEEPDGKLHFQLDAGAFGLGRVIARYHFQSARTVRIGSHEIKFDAGDSIRLFFSYRYTPSRVEKILKKFKLAVREQWITKSGEEGAFLCRRG